MNGCTVFTSKTDWEIKHFAALLDYDTKPHCCVLSLCVCVCV